MVVVARVAHGRQAVPLARTVLSCVAAMAAKKLDVAIGANTGRAGHAAPDRQGNHPPDDPSTQVICDEFHRQGRIAKQANCENRRDRFELNSALGRTLHTVITSSSVDWFAPPHQTAWCSVPAAQPQNVPTIWILARLSRPTLFSS